MTHDVIVLLSALGVVGMVIAGVLALLGALALFHLRGPLETVQSWLWGYELWSAFVVASVATGGSLFFSEIAHFTPCELCWYQRICMYPLSLLCLLGAVHGDTRLARYLLPFPVIGGGIAIYHILVENHVVSQAQECLASAPGGCATKWINEWGFVTIPTLALVGFVLLIEFLALAAADSSEPAATLAADG
ncbi:MAG TPA: disulfide bond formation protein B [Gaiellaceae bacterium]|nr:disulfide bond formation protein B [Gaiellaceae bacterium]